MNEYVLLQVQTGLRIDDGPQLVKVKVYVRAFECDEYNYCGELSFKLSEWYVFRALVKHGGTGGPATLSITEEEGEECQDEQADLEITTGP